MASRPGDTETGVIQLDSFSMHLLACGSICRTATPHDRLGRCQQATTPVEVSELPGPSSVPSRVAATLHRVSLAVTITWPRVELTFFAWKHWVEPVKDVMVEAAIAAVVLSPSDKLVKKGPM